MFQQVIDGWMLGSANSKSWMCAWVVAELVIPDYWNHTPQVRGKASSPMAMVRRRASFPK